ncbi:MAG TPA: alpha/beta fold hydrolase [Gemmatimonadaceae bacterium]|nr:alpha/beta fold hydrolase [Gemmatimonadaceae bacterium]
MEITRTASYKVWESRERAYLFARWSFEPANRAVVFVHGLMSSWDVWVPFRLLVERPEMASADVFYFDYKSLGTTIPRASRRFREALEGLLDGASPAFIHESLPPGRPKPTYATIDIVSHSLGAVVARTALTELASAISGEKDLAQPPAWKVDQLLLAPALLGSKLPWLMKYVGTEALLSAIQFVRNGGVSAVMDLKEGSDLLKRLENHVKDRIKESPVAAKACGLRVARTAHGEDDHVVIQNQYARDANYKLRDGNHFTIVPKAVAVDSDFIFGRAR